MIRNFREIKQGVDDLQINCPSADEGMWYRPERGTRCSVRYSLDEEALYDIYLRKEVGNYPNSPLEVNAKITLYDVKGCITIKEEEIFDFTFIGRQPYTQVFLINLIHYQNQIDELVREYATIVE